MRRFRALTVSAVIAVLASAGRADVPLPASFKILGTVSEAARPVADALVIALDLSTFKAIQTYTGPDGSFSLPQLQNAIYKVIALKQGFLPAATTVVPALNDHRLNLKLRSEKSARGRSASQEIWEIRGSLPPDILREVDNLLAPAMLAVSVRAPRFRGEMLSMTGVAPQAAGAAFAQTALGVESRIGENWQIGIRGGVQRFDDPGDKETFGQSLAESSVMSMEVRSSLNDSYTINSSRSSWRYADAVATARQADVQSHDFEWAHGDARLKVRYFAHDNVFQNSPFGSDMIEVGGDTVLMQTPRSDLGVSLRVRQESLRTTGTDPLRTAALSAYGTLDVGSSLVVHYGMGSRLGLDRSEVAPRTGLEWKLTRATSLIGSASYKVLDDSTEKLNPAFVSFDDGDELPRYSYSVGLVSSKNESNRFSAVATFSTADTPLRVVITDGTQQFWDSLYVESGDTRRDLRVGYRHDFGRLLAVDVSTSAGTATASSFTTRSRKVYVTGDLQTLVIPTRTTVLFSYRDIQQPQQAARDYRSSRVNVRMSQSLYLPIDVNLLIGIDLVRAENSPFLLDALMPPEETSKKYVAGLALNF